MIKLYLIDDGEDDSADSNRTDLRPSLMKAKRVRSARPRIRGR